MESEIEEGGEIKREEDDGEEGEEEILAGNEIRSTFRQRILEAQLRDEEYSVNEDYSELLTAQSELLMDSNSDTLQEMDDAIKKIQNWNINRLNLEEEIEFENNAQFTTFTVEEEKKALEDFTQANDQLSTARAGCLSLERLLDSRRGPQSELLDLSKLENFNMQFTKFPTIEELEKELQESKFKFLEEEARFDVMKSMDSARREDAILSDGAHLEGGLMQLQLEYDCLGRDLDSILNSMENIKTQNGTALPNKLLLSSSKTSSSLSPLPDTDSNSILPIPPIKR